MVQVTLQDWLYISITKEKWPAYIYLFKKNNQTDLVKLDSIYPNLKLGIQKILDTLSLRRKKERKKLLY